MTSSATCDRKIFGYMDYSAAAKRYACGDKSILVFDPTKVQASKPPTEPEITRSCKGEFTCIELKTPRNKIFVISSSKRCAQSNCAIRIILLYGFLSSK